MSRDIDWAKRDRKPLPVLVYWLVLLMAVSVAGMWWRAA